MSNPVTGGNGWGDHLQRKVEKLEAENAELKQERDEFELGADAEAKEVDRLNAENKRLRESMKISLPYITDELWDDYNETDLMTWNTETNRPHWTQLAVDFACVIQTKAALGQCDEKTQSVE